MTGPAILAAAVLLQVLLSVTGAAAIAWLVSPSSPCPLVAAAWRRLIVVTMPPAPGGITYIGGHR